MNNNNNNKIKNANAQFNSLLFEVKFEEARNKFFKLKLENYELSKQFAALMDRIEAEARNNAPIADVPACQQPDIAKGKCTCDDDTCADGDCKCK